MRHMDTRNPAFSSSKAALRKQQRLNRMNENAQPTDFLLLQREKTQVRFSGASKHPTNLNDSGYLIEVDAVLDVVHKVCEGGVRQRPERVSSLASGSDQQVLVQHPVHLQHPTSRESTTTKQGKSKTVKIYPAALKQQQLSTYSRYSSIRPMEEDIYQLSRQKTI